MEAAANSTASSSSSAAIDADPQLKSIGEQRRIAQLEHRIATVCKQLDEKSTQFKQLQQQHVSLRDRLSTLEQEKLEASLFNETLAKSRDRLIQEKTDLRNELLTLEQRKDELELLVSKQSNDKRHCLDEIDELRKQCAQLCGARTELQSQIDDFQSDKAIIAYDKEQWKREKEILLASKQWYVDEIAARERKTNELIEAKSEAARHLLECQNECHALRLAADRQRHEADVQARLLDAKEALVMQLQDHIQQCAHERDEAEARAAHYARERDELQLHAEQQLVQHQREAESWANETQRKLSEERAKIVDELCTQNAAELDRVRLEATNTQQCLTEMLKKASEKHRQLEDERNRLFERHKLLEDNLGSYKRRFVAELQRAMGARCSQLGDGVRNAFLDVVGQMGGAGDGLSQQRSQHNSGGWRAQPPAPISSPDFSYAGDSVDHGRITNNEQIATAAPVGIGKNGTTAPAAEHLSDSVFEPCENQSGMPRRQMSSSTSAAAQPSSGNNPKDSNKRAPARGGSLLMMPPATTAAPPATTTAIATDKTQQQRQKTVVIDNKENRRPPSSSTAQSSAAVPKLQRQRHAAGGATNGGGFANDAPQCSAMSSTGAARLVQQQRKRSTVSMVPPLSPLFPGGFLPPRQNSPRNGGGGGAIAAGSAASSGNKRNKALLKLVLEPEKQPQHSAGGGGIRTKKVPTTTNSSVTAGGMQPSTSSSAALLLNNATKHLSSKFPAFRL